MQSLVRQKPVTLAATLCVVFLGCAAPRAARSLSEHDEGWGPRATPRSAVAVSAPGWSSRNEEWFEAEIKRISQRLGSESVPSKVTVIEELLADSGTPSAAHPLPILQPLFVGLVGDWYFNVRAIRGLRFENELAAAVAAARSLSLVAPQTEASWRVITRNMVRELYRAGYDPRGVSSFWKNWGSLLTRGNQPGFEAPSGALSWPQLAVELEDESNQEIAKLPPLLNPVVRSPEFAKIGKRLQKL
jgi:hypothetical protein